MYLPHVPELPLDSRPTTKKTRADWNNRFSYSDFNWHACDRLQLVRSKIDKIIAMSTALPQVGMPPSIEEELKIGWMTRFKWFGHDWTILQIQK